MLEALNAARERKTSIVTQLVSSGAANARDIAVAASNEFGVPLFDLDAVNLDLETVRLVNDKLIAKHRVLPLFRRGKRLFLAVADPTNLHAIDEIKFQTSLGIEAVVVEDDKLQKAIDKAIEQAEAQMPPLTDEDGVDLESLEVTGGEDELDDKIGRDDVEDAPIVRFVNKVMLDAIRRGASDIHFEPYEKILSRAIAHGRRAEGNRATAGAARRQAVGAPQGHVAARHRRAARAAGRAHQDEAVEEPRHRLPREHLSDAVRREDRDAYSRSLAGDARASTRWATSPSRRTSTTKYLAKPQGMILVTGPTGSGKTVSLYTGLNILNREDTNISTAEDPAEINLPGVNQVNVNPKVGLTFAAAMRAFLRQDPDVIMVGEIRDLETAEIAIKAAQTGPPRAFDSAHERCAADPDATGRHGREALRDRDLGQPDHRATSGAPAVRALQAADGHPARGAAQGGLHGGGRAARAAGSSAPRAAEAAPTATRAVSASTRCCRSPTRSPASSWPAAAPSISATRQRRKACGICAARASRRSRQA